jgi:hypothetical protein
MLVTFSEAWSAHSEFAVNILNQLNSILKKLMMTTTPTHQTPMTQHAAAPSTAERAKFLGLIW